MAKWERMKIWEEEHSHSCLDCGKTCDYRANRCPQCAAIERAKDRVGKKKNGPNWRKGYYFASGYKLVWSPNHPRASRGYVREHVLVWEQVSGKSLPQGWIIHHLNGIGLDNRPVNLVALPNKTHYRVLAAKAKRIQELEANISNQRQLC